MALDIWIPLAVWLGIGALIAVYLYRYMDKEGKVEYAWVIAGLLLSVLGLMAFIGVRSMKDKERDKAVDPQVYEPPAYKLKAPEGEVKKAPAPKEEPKPEQKPKKAVKQIEGIPRCPECGAAISSADERCRDCGAKLKG